MANTRGKKQTNKKNSIINSNKARYNKVTRISGALLKRVLLSLTWI